MDNETQVIIQGVWDMVTLHAVPAGAARLLGSFFGLDDGALFAVLALMQEMTASDLAALQRDWIETRAREEAALAARSETAGQSREREKVYEVQDGIAYISMAGLMTKSPTCMSTMFGSGTSTTQVRLALRQADQDSDVVSKMLRIDDSPGGEVSGAFDLAHDVAKAGRKATDVYVEDMAASGAYLAASGARSIQTNVNAAMGSIGVYTRLIDSSRQAAEAGVQVHVIKAGRFKAAGVPGAPVTPDHIQATQQRIDAIQSLFVKAVRRGRPGMTMDNLAEVADAGVYIGRQAVKLGLSDGISTLDAAHKMAVQRNKDAKKTEVVSMAVTQETLAAWLADDTITAPATADDAVAAAPAQAGPSTVPATATVDSTLLASINKAGINNIDDLGRLVQLAAIGTQVEADARTRTKRLAIAALGTNGMAADKQAAAIAAAERAIDASSHDVVTAMANAYEHALGQSGMIAANGSRPQRLTAPAAPNVTVTTPANATTTEDLTSQQVSDNVVSSIISSQYAAPANSNAARRDK